MGCSGGWDTTLQPGLLSTCWVRTNWGEFLTVPHINQSGKALPLVLPSFWKNLRATIKSLYFTTLYFNTTLDYKTP